MKNSHQNKVSKKVSILTKLMSIEAEAIELNREINHETEVTIAWHAYAKKHHLQGRQYRIEYNRWMAAHDLERLMIPALEL